MNTQEKGIAVLIKSAIDARPGVLPEGFDLTEAVKIALRHKIVGLVYYGAILCGVDKKCEQMQKLFCYLVSVITVTERQRSVHQQLMCAFEENGIDYMPLKGVVIQDLYPKAEMRTMGDADILIRVEQYNRIQPLMESLNFEFLRENDHELAWKLGKIEIELHKRMIPSHNEDLYAYFGDGWEFAHKAKNGKTRYQLSNEDYYIHIFTHMTKHYRSAGIGIKHMVDLWIFRKFTANMDEQYISQAMEKLGLLAFYQNVMQTIQVWFAEAPSTAITDCITTVVFESGEFGLSGNREIAKILKESKTAGSVQKVKRREFWNALFLPMTPMKAKYPVLKKVPVLLPVMWVVRVFQVLIFRRQKIERFMGKSSARSNKNINQRRMLLKFVGLSAGIEE